MKVNKKFKDKKGFTLVELLVVIGIVAVPTLFKNINKAKAADYNAFKSTSLSYYTDNNTYSTELIQ